MTTVDDLPRGLEGVVVSTTTIGDVRGDEGFFHYRGYSGADLARDRDLTDVVALLVDGALPSTAAEHAAIAAELQRGRAAPAELLELLPVVAGAGGVPMDHLRSALSLAGQVYGLRPVHDLDPAARRRDALRIAAVVPTLVAGLHRASLGLAPVTSRPDLDVAADYLWMLTGEEPEAAHARAVDQYLVLTVDHGFNASTFTARIATSTGGDLAGIVTAALATLSGPLHGGAPSRALEMLDEIGDHDRAGAYVRDVVARDGRVMGFGHRVYRTHDPRSEVLHETARAIDAPLLGLAEQVEDEIVTALAELKPGRELYANVEYYAGVVMDAAGIPRELFTPTFTISRSIGWVAHSLEQAADNRLVRPASRYVGEPAPRPVPAPPYAA
ncbi:MAG: citrate/2-methylcitrate synthase [Acidimicrobiia bacterium]